MNQQVRTCSCCTRSPHRPPVVLRLAEVMAITKLSKPTIYRRMKAASSFSSYRFLRYAGPL